jgi:hypothetical protein
MQSVKAWRIFLLVVFVLAALPGIAYAGFICYSSGTRNGERCMRCDNFGPNGEYLGYVESCGPMVI